MDLAVDLGCRADERPATNNYDYNGHRDVLDSNRPRRGDAPRNNTARRRR